MAERLHPYNLGETAAASELETLLGYRGFFSHVDHDNTAKVKPVDSGATIEAIWVKNVESSTAIKPGTLVKWDTGATYGPGKGVLNDAANTSTKTAACGVADDNLATAGVAAGKHFWIIVKGPTKMQATVTTTVTKGDAMILGAAGRMAVPSSVTTPTAKDAFYRVGTAMETVSTPTADQLIKVYADIQA